MEKQYFCKYRGVGIRMSRRNVNLVPQLVVLVLIHLLNAATVCSYRELAHMLRVNNAFCPGQYNICTYNLLLSVEYIKSISSFRTSAGTLPCMQWWSAQW